MKTKRAAVKRKSPKAKPLLMVLVEQSFAEIAGFIAQSRQRAYQAANTTLIALYWGVVALSCKK